MLRNLKVKKSTALMIIFSPRVCCAAAKESVKEKFSSAVDHPRVSNSDHKHTKRKINE
jgi:hypothetical protein